jgi:hypothetical protein
MSRPRYIAIDDTWLDVYAHDDDGEPLPMDDIEGDYWWYDTIRKALKDNPGCYLWDTWTGQWVDDRVPHWVDWDLPVIEHAGWYRFPTEDESLG